MGRNLPVAGRLCGWRFWQSPGLNPAGPKPAKVGKAVEITDRLGVDDSPRLAQRYDMPFGTAADGPGDVERRGAQGGSRRGPAIVSDLMILLDVVDDRSQAIDHRGVHELKLSR